VDEEGLGRPLKRLLDEAATGLRAELVTDDDYIRQRKESKKS
jgi:hypothetical protein